MYNHVSVALRTDFTNSPVTIKSILRAKIIYKVFKLMDLFR